MSLRVLDLRGARPPFDAALPRPTAPGADVHDAVARILSQVREHGDEALLRYTAELDGVDVRSGLRVPDAELEAARSRVEPDLLKALEVAFGRILAYHEHEGDDPGDFVDGGITVSHLTRPVGRAGIYAPGGRARYPSTVLMCAAPARVAGVASIALCVPPAADGRVDDATLCAASVAGVDEVYRIGGAQAIAAMAYGTESVPAVDVIAGPGNAYVAEAKRQVSGVVGVASAFAGPSEIVVMAAPGATLAFAAIDLVVQAEHGPDGLAWLVTWDADLLSAVSAEVDRIVAASSRRADLESTLASAGIACLVDSPKDALAVCNAVAPEHLQLMVPASDVARAARRRAERRCGVRRRLVPGQHGRLRGGTEPRAPDQPDRALRLCAARRRFPQARARGARDPRRAPGTWSARRDAGRGRGPARPRRFCPTSPRSPRRRQGAALVSAVPPVRPDLALSEGYHSPQVDAEVRLNTNESPLPPPDAWRGELLEALADVSFHRYPNRPATELRNAVAALHGVSAAEIFCANGSNEVLQSLLLAFGGPGRWALVFEPTYALHSHIARITGTEVVEGARDDDFQIDPEDAVALIGESRPDVTFLCSPNNPTGRAEPPATVAAVCGAAPGLVIVDEAYGQFAPWSALELHGPAHPGLVRDPDLLQDVGDGRCAPRVPGGRPDGGHRL